MSLLLGRGLCAHFGGVKAVDGVDLSIEAGSIHGLIGPNGAGKTTLINIISGLIPATSGTLEFDGRAGGPWRIERAVRLGVVRTFQQTRAFLGLTVRENLRIAAAAAGDNALDDEIVAGLGLGAILDLRADDLPYAALRRLGIALALTLKPKLLLLDEPAVGLTPPELEKMSSIIRRWNAQGVTVLLVEHNMAFLMSLAQRVSVMARGRMLFEGAPQECQASRLVIDTYLGTATSDAAH